jgi:hypothetical protein
MPKAKVITLTPTALDADGTSTTETLLATRLDYLINGAHSSGFDRNGICLAQTNGAAAALTLNGAQGTNFADRNGVFIQIFAGSDNTGITFAVLGTNRGGAIISETITGPDAGLTVLGAVKFWHITSITSSAAVTDNCEVGTNGSVTYANPQHVNSTHAGDDSGETVTFIGEDRYGRALTETITGGSSAAVSSENNFAKVDRIVASAAGANAVTAGTDALCESKWHVLNYRGRDFTVGLGLDITGGPGAGTGAVQHTFNNVLSEGFREIDATVYTHDSMHSKTANFDGNYTNPPVACRLAITAYTSGSISLRIVQAG